MQGFLCKALAVAAVLQASSAAPAEEHGGKLEVLETMVTPDGQVIDWVVTESQGRIASPPPPPEEKRSGVQPRVEALVAEVSGPDGAVPILRSGGPTMPLKRLPQPSDDGAGTGVQRRSSAAGQHWYASTSQSVANLGGKATFSLYKAYTQSATDFSLLQTAVIHDNSAHAGTGAVTQTVEAGWINFSSQVQAPHLFTYFTTNGYTAHGDYVGSWNRDMAGWVQIDKTIYPGVAFSNLSVDGGAQYELEIGYYLYQGNWWLWVVDRYVGYYPASLFSPNVDPAQTLARGSGRINFYGEIYNSEDAVTTTDMGSGEFPEKGFGHAAYLHNVVYYDNNSYVQDYDVTQGIIVSDASRYRIQTSFKSGSAWGSYFYLGGPGAGGVVGG